MAQHPRHDERAVRVIGDRFDVRNPPVNPPLARDCHQLPGGTEEVEQRGPQTGITECFLRGAVFALGCEEPERADNPYARFRRPDYGVRELLGECVKRAGEALAALGDLLPAHLSRIRRTIDLAPVQHVNRALSAHDGQLYSRPDEQLVGTQLPRAHRLLGAAVPLAEVQRDLGNRRLRVGEEHLCAVTNDPVLSCATPGMKPGTSTRVTIGMLNASQKRMKREPLSDASTSIAPASQPGWLATKPTVAPSMRPKPTTMLRANRGFTSRKSPASTSRLMTFVML
jgi:hypothetical protein